MKYLKTYEIFNIIPKIKENNFYIYSDKNFNEIKSVVKCVKINDNLIFLHGYFLDAYRIGNRKGQEMYDVLKKHEISLLKKANKKLIAFYKDCELKNTTDKYNI